VVRGQVQTARVGLGCGSFAVASAALLGTLLELEAALGRPLGGGRVDLVLERLDNVGIGPLVVGGDEVGGIGDVAGEVRDAAQDMLDGILALARDSGGVGELVDLLLDSWVCLLVAVNRFSRNKQTYLWPSSGTGDRNAPWDPWCPPFCVIGRWIQRVVI
jgi:hypothetical protein